MSLTPLDKQAARRSFERAASSYNQHAVLQREVGSRLLERVTFFEHQPAVVLDLGSGTGQSTLTTQFASANVISMDWSTAMLKASGQPQAKHEWRVCADMHSLPLAPRSVDLVFSNLALPWSNDPAVVFQELRRVMKTGALLAFSCYGPDTLNELKQAWRTVDNYPRVNDFPDMHDVGDELVKSGFAEPVMDAEILTLEYPDFMSLLRELKATGSQNVAQQRAKGLTSRSRLQAVEQAYQQYKRDNCYPASIEISYGLTFAPANDQAIKFDDAEVATFSIDAFRNHPGR